MKFKKCCVVLMQLVCLEKKFVLLLNLCYLDMTRDFLPDSALLVGKAG